ncbi:contactin [Phlebotomus argentipes]|uniref:contactin n=1 Tax=Phlebotomus argentipes TaxID=94469 RepID=UPI0028932FC0|nr:contactin [Phlebotomus argentipes]
MILLAAVCLLTAVSAQLRDFRDFRPAPVNISQSNWFETRPAPNAYSNLDGIPPEDLCPQHWTAYRTSCMRFIGSPKRSWHDGKKICQAYGADLVHIDSLEKHSFILQQLIKKDQRTNRYFISARQTSPSTWVNDDNTAFVAPEDGLSLDPQDLRTREYLETSGQLGHLSYAQIERLLNPRDPLATTHQIPRDRLVYGFSPSHDRWMFIPAYDFEQNLFICESRELYGTRNANTLAEDRRTIEYGVQVVDEERLPQGPHFVLQPRDTTFDTGKRKIADWVTVECLAEGYPAPTYTWFKEVYESDRLTFKPVSALTDRRIITAGGSLVITAPEQNRDQGTYHCVAENKFGRILSNSIQLNFGYIMEFNLKRSPESGDMNWGKSLFCDPPQHYPNVKYYWSFNWFPNFVEEDERRFVSFDGALYFSALETNDRANYSCTVQSLVSDTGRNGPFFPLRVRPHPNYQELLFANTFPKVFPEAPIAGQEVRMECMAFGYPVPSFNWTRRDGNLPRHSYLISYGRVLILPNATINDSGEYVCTVGNDRKSTSKSIRINIQMAPNFTIPLVDKIRDLNTDVSFVCEASAIPDANYTWYKNAELLEQHKLPRDKFIIQDNVLTIKFLEPSKDDGMYQCRAENQIKAVYSSAQLRVLSLKPTFKKRPLEAEIYAIASGNTTIICDPEAAPQPTFQWKKDGIVIGSGGHRRILPLGNLLISPTSRDDEGVYTCVASNAYGTAESHARLIVLQELRFHTALPARQVLQAGELLFLHCDVNADALLDVTFEWRRNGALLPENLNDRRVLVDRNRLEVHNTSLLDSGEYECIAMAALHRVTSRTEVSIQGPPGAPGGVKVIDIKKTSAVLEWIDGPDNGRPVLFYNIWARTTWNKTWGPIPQSVEAREFDRYTGRKRAEVRGLNPWSGYEFRVRAVNDVGMGPMSPPSPLYSTLNDVPYEAPARVGGGGGKIGDLVITWKPLPPIKQNSQGIYYKISWRLHGKGGATEWATKLIHDSETGRAVVPTPLDNYYTKYDVKVQAFNDQGPGPESPVETIYSAEDMPQVAPQRTYSRGFNSTAINVTWAPVELTREKIRGRLIGHRLKYWRSDIAEENAVYYLSRTTRPWALIVGLQPDTYYYTKVMVYNAAGEGPESERYLERTYRKAPQKPPSSVNYNAVNPSTVRVTWRYVTPSQEEEPIEGYKVRVWESDQDMATANDTIIPIGRKLEAYIDKLAPGKAYKMRVLAFSNGGDGRMSSPTLNFQMGRTRMRNAASAQAAPLALVLCLVVATVWRR